jgi:DNA repair protein NreA
MIKSVCILCKGSRDLCRKGRCELLDSINIRFPQARTDQRTKDLFGSSPPTLFVGRYGYPSVDIGPMLSRDPIPAAWRLNTPEYWYGRSIEEIITLRTELVRSRSRVNVRKPAGKILDVSQELAMSNRAVDTEVQFEKEIVLHPSLVVDAFAPPRGPMVWIKHAELTENPRIPRKVDAIVGDTDARAVDGASELYGSSISTYHLQRLLSAGLLGQKQKRRLVPTRWSITAMDDMIGKELMKQVRDFSELGEVLLYHGSYAGNHFHIIYIPRPWSFEMLETWLKGAFWAAQTASFHDHEPFKGRTTYASRITGAYYAARLSILEHLIRLRRQGTVIVNREITEEYIAPLGVWVIRETVKRALEGPPERPGSLENALKLISGRVRKKNWVEFSELLKEVRTQRRLDDFLGPGEGPHAP